MKFHVPQTCDADWEKMTLGVHVRHCAQCDREVVDFCGMSRSEVIQYLLARKAAGERVCGRAHRSQLDFTIEDIQGAMADLRAQPATPGTVRLLGLLSMMLLAACAQPETGTPPQTGLMQQGVPQVQVDTLEQACVPDSIPPRVLPQRLDTVVDVMSPDDIIMGDFVETPPYPPETDSLYTEDTPFTQEEFDESKNHVAVFGDGDRSIQEYIQELFRVPEGQHPGPGTIVASFIVGRSGEVRNVRFLQTIPGAGPVEQEIRKLLEGMPRWSPGIQNGSPIPTEVRLPFRFAAH